VDGVDLSGRRAFVTGASRGIGAAIAGALAGAGAEVISGYRTTAAVPHGAPFRCDHAKPALPPGPLHILVNNAGIWVPTPVDGGEWDANWGAILQTNLRAVAELCRLFAAQAGPGSAIVNVSSRASHRGEPRYSAYAASKAAVNALTKSLATELGPRGIRVNAVAPGWVRTDMSRDALPARGLPEPIPLGRVGEPADVAGPVLFLCSDLARYVTGVVLDVCGGAYLH
jgi:NAD(P)-dependent dehydrogenase (short-subunit alcohol dehydrogenase family)